MTERVQTQSKQDAREGRGIAASQEMIGFLISVLIENGLRQRDINPTDLFPATDSNSGNEEEAIQLALLCSDTMNWLIDAVSYTHLTLPTTPYV